MERIKVRKKCRVCDTVPKDGFRPARAKRRDWICPPCEVTERARRRREKRKQK